MMKWTCSLLGIFIVLPLYAITPSHKGVAHYRAGNYEAAKQYFLQGNTADDYYNLGNAHAKLHQYDLALEAYTKALTLQPDFPDAKFNHHLVSQVHEQQFQDMLTMQHLIDDPSGFLRVRLNFLAKNHQRG